MAILDDATYSQLKQILASDPAWVDLTGSQFVEHLAIFVGLIVGDANLKVERARQEAFVGTAINRSSITAFVEDRDYMPKKPTPSTGNVTITNQNSNPVTLIKGREFLSETQRYYTLTSTVTIPANGSILAAVEQTKTLAITNTVSTKSAFYEVLIDRDYTSQVAGIDVTVDQGDGDGPVAWVYHRLFQNCFAATKAWDEFYRYSDQYGVRFGNGTFGLIPAANSTINVNLILTDGATVLMAKQQLYPILEVLDSAGNTATLNIVAASLISGGTDMEGTETIRRNLHYWPVYNEKLVWAEDYTYFIRRRFPEVVFVKAWGEEEAEKMEGFSFDHVNKIYICAYANRDGVEADVMAALAEVPKMNRKFQWVDPVHVTFFLTITGKVLSNVAISQVETDIKTVLNRYYGKNSSDRRDSNLMSEMYQAVYSTGHFNEDSGAYFTLEASGAVSPELIYQMPSIDLDACVFNLTYTS